MTLTILYALVFISALIAAEAAIRTLVRKGESNVAINRRVRLIDSSQDYRKTYNDMLKERGVDNILTRNPAIQAIRLFYTQSGITFVPSRFALYGVAGALVLWVAVQYMIASTFYRIPVFILLCILIPIAIVWRARASRMHKFTLKLPEALDVANRSIAAGHPLTAAIALVSREMPDPIGSEFGLLSDELTYGLTLDNALANLNHRVGVEDLNLLAIALSVQAGTGGNLVEILQNLSKTLRARTMLKAKVKSISAEGRITGIFMSAYPFMLYALIVTIAPTYFDPVWESGYAATVLWIIAAVMAVGNFILYKLVNFEF